jgi:hypothetical protein
MTGLAWPVNGAIHEALGRWPQTDYMGRMEEPSSDRLDFMEQHEQSEWIGTHIPHRVRAAIARIDMENSLLRVKAFIDPALQTDEDKIYWRCSTDSIWEGRLAATRWLIEFVGIKEKDGNPVACQKRRKDDVRIDDFNGGDVLDPSTPNGRRLADVWKGCSQAASHATNAYTHPSLDDRTVLPEALKIILNHLQDTIYDKASKKLRDYVLVP